jgi:hypothetical protein
VKVCLESSLTPLAATLSLGSLLELLRADYGGYELLDHWQQGEFHHDVVVKAGDGARLPGVLVIATNCNGGVKELLAFADLPDRDALWHFRCPEVADFAGVLPELLGREVTGHWFEPCELLAADARSELRPEFRRRQKGGGWCAR